MPKQERTATGATARRNNVYPAVADVPGSPSPVKRGGHPLAQPLGAALGLSQVAARHHGRSAKMQKLSRAAALSAAMRGMAPKALAPVPPALAAPVCNRARVAGRPWQLGLCLDARGPR